MGAVRSTDGLEGQSERALRGDLRGFEGQSERALKGNLRGFERGDPRVGE